MTPALFDLDRRLLEFLAEDLGTDRDVVEAFSPSWCGESMVAGDITSMSMIAADRRSRARLIAKSAGVVAGLRIAGRVFELLAPELSIEYDAQDGDAVSPRTELARIEGSSRAILAAERVALNLLQRMSGIATLTARFVREVAGTGAMVLETRKTAPGLRWFDKLAVRLGGGTNHRFGLFDQILVKENHLAAFANGGIRTSVQGEARRPLEEALRSLRSLHPKLVLEIEVWSPQEAERAAKAGADIVLLDNFDLRMAREAVERTRSSAALLEFSGGVRLEQARSIAETGVDRISVGALTHSVEALDVSLLFDEF